MLMSKYICYAKCPLGINGRPTKRAPDGWWALLFELVLSEKFGSVSLVGSPSRR